MLRRIRVGQLGARDRKRVDKVVKDLAKTEKMLNEASSGPGLDYLKQEVPGY